jgi:hypothetical protein
MGLANRQICWICVSLLTAQERWYF